MSTPSDNGNGGKKRGNGWIWKGGISVAAILLLVLVFRGPGGGDGAGPTFAARQGALEVTVIEGGEVRAEEAQEIRSEVQGRTTILSIVEEGYQVTQEDIDNGLILVELDSSELEEDLTQQEITYQNALSSLTEAQEGYEIQLSENESDIHDAELALMFARMDLQQFLGDELGAEIVEMVDARNGGADYASGDRRLYASTEFDPSEVELEELDAEDIPEVELDIDYLSLLEDPRLGGEAQQRIRDLESDITLAQEELAQAEDRHTWTMELAEQGFVTANEEEQDRLSVQRREIDLQARDTARELYRLYEFPKELEDLISDYEQRQRGLERTQRQASARIAQAEARLRSRQSTYDLEARRLEEYREQLENCIIRAERPGIVVYAAPSGRGNDDIIEEGTEVRERQEILTIPDMTQMAVEVQVHESMVNRLSTELPARIRADSFPEQVLQGEVTRVALVPDSGHRWLNPDLRVFPTTVSIEGQHDWLKPGVTAEVEILVDRIEDAVHVPVQSVVTQGRHRYVYVVDGGQVEVRPVEVGTHNQSFIEIRSGLAEGEHVLLRPPREDRDREDDADDLAPGDEVPMGEQDIPGPSTV